jgi:hypothetical protein
MSSFRNSPEDRTQREKRMDTDLERMADLEKDRGDLGRNIRV